MTFRAGILLPRINASTNEKPPAPSPFMVTMIKGSLAEIFRVKLLSIPQRIHAATKPNEPREKPHSAFRFIERKILARVINAIAQPARRLIDSLKAKNAIRVVATPSKHKSNDAVAAGVIFKLKSRRMGAATPPAIIAPANHR